MIEEKNILQIQNSTLTGYLFVVVLIFAMALPMLVLYAISTLGPLLSQDLTFDSTMLGYLVMSSFGLAAILSLWSGVIVEYFGARNMLLVIFFTIAVAFMLIAIAQNFTGLVFAVAICGIAQALANPVTNLLIAQQITQKKRAKIVGIKQSGVQLAALFAGLLLPGIALLYGWRIAFGAVVPVAVIFLLSTLFVTPKVQFGVKKSFEYTFPNPLLLWLMCIQFCIGISLSAYVTFLPTFAIQQGMTLFKADSLIAVFGVMGMLSRIVLTPVGAKLRDESWLLCALAVIAAGAIVCTMYADINSHELLWLGAACVGLSAVGTNAIAMSMVIRDSAFGPVTAASSFISVAFFGGFALGPPLYALLVDYSSGFLLGWKLLSGVFVCACILALALAFSRRQHADRLTEKTT
ncbi:CynX/NimT family MFS transporter [Nitrosomonas marina]|uniref:Predicted arabinose efflux permease, MFS family n=1 Tax=Nitrosomonas marina TaxID=917 RepID=A0A1H8AGM0_9PROT|nr:MFS transporter [Nitrosomonas marina]SEM69636.1 Predicted arabinose efflux permease, MFS family [Nitrosomonas marina]